MAASLPVLRETDQKEAALALNAQAAIAAPDFQMLFEQAPSLYLVLDVDFNVLAASDVYLQTTLTRRESILGRNLFDIFPVNPDEPEGEGSRNLRISLQRVLATGQEDSMAMQKYDIPREDGSFEERYWSPTNWPVKRADGSVACIMHSVQDVSSCAAARPASAGGAGGRRAAEQCCGAGG